MTVKTKILIPMILAAVVTAIVLVLVLMLRFSSYVTEEMEKKLDSYQHVLQDQIINMKASSYDCSHLLARDEQVVRAVLSNNKTDLNAQSQEMIKAFNLDFCTVTDDRGMVIYRSLQQDKSDDSLADTVYVKAALDGNEYVDVDLGTDVKLSVLATVPVYSADGKIVGTVSTGNRLDDNAFVERMQGIIGVEVTVFLGDERLSTTVVDANGKRAVGTKAAPEVSALVLAGNTYRGSAQILGQDAFVSYSPLIGTNGKPVGMLFAGEYKTASSKAISDFLLLGVLISLILALIVIIVAIGIARMISKPVVALSEFYRRASSTGDINISPTDKQILTGYTASKDELGQMVLDSLSFIDHVVESAHELDIIARGDLTVDIDILSDQDTLSLSMQKMTDNLNQLFNTVNDSTVQVTSGSKQVADGAQILAQGSIKQSASIEELSEAIAGITEMAKENTHAATEALDEAQQTGQLMGVCMEQMEQMLGAMQTISEKSQNISKTTKVIDEIAFQTNILALNAAVEAARAGQHGKGFAVVAEEVRNLAAKSAEAAKETGDLIESSFQSVSEGGRIVEQVNESLRSVADLAQKQAGIIANIQSASVMQNSAIEQINAGIEEMNHFIHQNSATAQESAAASEEMSSHAHLLQELVTQFKLRSES